MKSRIIHARLGAMVTLLSIVPWNAMCESVVETDMAGVYQSGSSKNTLIPTPALKRGTYVIGPATENDWDEEEDFLIVEPFINNPDKFLAIQFPRAANLRRGSMTAYLYFGKSIKNGASIMLSPITINPRGKEVIDAEDSPDAPVVEIRLRPGRFEYPYLFLGRNGAFGGKIRGMKGFGGPEPSLRSRPSDGVFVSGQYGNPSLVVTGNEVTFYQGSRLDSTYSIVELNGIEGKLAALTSSSLDTMTEGSIYDEKFSQFAAFVTGGCFEEEQFLQLIPTGRQGQYSLEVHAPSQPSLWDMLFPGRRSPWSK